MCHNIVGVGLHCRERTLAWGLLFLSAVLAVEVDEFLSEITAAVEFFDHLYGFLAERPILSSKRFRIGYLPVSLTFYISVKGAK